MLPVRSSFVVNCTKLALGTNCNPSLFEQLWLYYPTGLSLEMIRLCTYLLVIQQIAGYYILPSLLVEHTCWVASSAYFADILIHLLATHSLMNFTARIRR